jgi:branched-chain amino acid transport system substrate-binding protein
MHAITPSNRRPGLRRLTVISAAGLLLSATAFTSGSSATTSTSASDSRGRPANNTSILGPKNVAHGAPINVGVVSDGRTPTFDNTVELRAADAVGKYVNDYRGGFAGRPINLVKCEANGDPGKTSDCANQLIQANVALVIAGAISNNATLHTALHSAHIPLFVFGTGDQSILSDADSTFQLASANAGLSALPIAAAQKHKIAKVNAVVIDVPAATSFYTGVGKRIFDTARVKLNLVAVPPGTPDVTPQITQITSGGKSAVFIIGDETLCIAAIKGLRAANFSGPITTLNYCDDAAIKKAVGSGMKGVIMAASSPLGDTKDPGYRLFTAIIHTYGSGSIDPSSAQASNMFSTILAARDALEGLTGTVTTASIISTIKAMPEKPVPAGGGIRYRCNGKADPSTPAVCTRGVLQTILDSNGNPTLPYQVVGNTPIPG